MERLKAAEEAKGNPDRATTGKQQKDGEGGGTGDASTLTSSVLFALILATLF